MWTSILSTSVTSQGRGNPTPLPAYAGVVVASGATQAFFVVVTNIRYTNGNTEGSLYAENSHMQFFEGIGRSSKEFDSASIYSPRVWNGAIRYTLESVPPAPVTPAPVTPAPITPAPVTPAPVTPAPVTSSPGLQDALDLIEEAIAMLEAL